MNAWEWITAVVFGALGVGLIAWSIWLAFVSDYLYDRRERKAIRASCRACQGTPVILLTGDAAKARYYDDAGGTARDQSPLGQPDRPVRPAPQAAATHRPTRTRHPGRQERPMSDVLRRGEPMTVTRREYAVVGGTMSTPDPPMNEDWDHFDRLRWHAGVAKHDTGLTLTISEWVDGRYSINGHGIGIATQSYWGTWRTITDLSLGAEMAASIARGDLRSSDL